MFYGTFVYIINIIFWIISAGAYIYFRERVRDQYIASEAPTRK